jgi:hypothetical protein
LLRANPKAHAAQYEADVKGRTEKHSVQWQADAEERRSAGADDETEAECTCTRKRKLTPSRGSARADVEGGAEKQSAQ